MHGNSDIDFEACEGPDAHGAASRRPVVGRFAPSPTGRMHAGNIYAALIAWLAVKSQGGRMVLRIEDLDRERSKSSYVDQIQRDFEALGLFWDEGPYFQHDREAAYAEAFSELKGKGLVYPCFCTRADLHAASAPHRGEKLVYPGTCRHLSADEVKRRRACGKACGWRLAVDDRTVSLDDLVQGPYRQRLDRDCGDFLIRRSDDAFAYQLAVVVDDAAQGVTEIVRGVDLLCSTPQQMYLQELLGLPHPAYAHIPLLTGEKDRRLSKRDRDAALDELLACFGSPEAVIGHIACVAGLIPEEEPVMPEELLEEFTLKRFREGLPDLVQIPWRS